MRIPDLKKEFKLEADASNVGIGAVLNEETKPIDNYREVYLKTKELTV